MLLHLERNMRKEENLVHGTSKEDVYTKISMIKYLHTTGRKENIHMICLLEVVLGLFVVS